MKYWCIILIRIQICSHLYVILVVTQRGYWILIFLLFELFIIFANFSHGVFRHFAFFCFFKFHFFANIFLNYYFLLLGVLFVDDFQAEAVFLVVAVFFATVFFVIDFLGIWLRLSYFLIAELNNISQLKKICHNILYGYLKNKILYVYKNAHI